MFDGKFRTSVDGVTAPIGKNLDRVGFSADALTFSGLLFSIAAGWAIAEDYFWWAIALIAIAGLHDLMDGAVAKASSRASQRGSFFDSVVDRLSDASMLAGVTYWLLHHRPGNWALLPFAAQAAGLHFPLLLQRLLEEAFIDHQALTDAD